MENKSTPVVWGLLIVNGLVFAAEMKYAPLMFEWLALWPAGLLASHDTYAAYGGPPFRPWQLLSYGFMHGGILHLALNMYALWLFGRLLEAFMGSQRFLVFYLGCVMGAALLHLAVEEYVMLHGIQPNSVVGASGGTFGVLTAFAMLSPNTVLRLLFPPIPIKAKWFVLGYGALELFFGVTGTASGIAHFAHLGGMVAAFVMIRSWFRRRPAA